MGSKDLSAFTELKSKKVPWAERLAAIEAAFPRAVKLDWQQAFNSDIELFGRMLRDILKVDQTQPGRSGPRPVLDRTLAGERLKQFQRADFSELEFRDAFAALAHGKSHRGLQARTGLNRNMIQKLLAGSREPDMYVMEQIAHGFKKSPSYFLEYRMAYVLGALAEKMANAPEMTIDLYKKLNPR